MRSLWGRIGPPPPRPPEPRRDPTWEPPRGTSPPPPPKARPTPSGPPLLLIGGDAALPFVDWFPPPTMNPALGVDPGSRPGIAITTGGRDRPPPHTHRPLP